MLKLNGTYYIHGIAFATRDQALIHLYCLVVSNPNHMHQQEEQ